MNLSPQQKLDIDDRWLETLLNESYHQPSSVDEGRWRQLKLAIDKDVKVSTSTTSHPEYHRIAFGLIAASVLLLLGYNLFSNALRNDAYAAIERCESIGFSPQEYRFQMTQQIPLIGKREVDAKLFLDGNGRFVVEHPGWLGLDPLFIGGDSSSRWIVPRIGPAIKGRERLIGGWLSRRDIPSPYLHLQTVLDRLKHAYHLELSEVSAKSPEFAGPEIRMCQHVRGTVRSPRQNLPASIELWVDKESGLARRLIVRWERAPQERGPLVWQIDYVGPTLQRDDFFTLEGHVDDSRRILDIQHEQQLTSVGSEL